MTKKHTTMGHIKTAKIAWSLEELTALVNDENSHVHLVKAKRHIALHPCQLSNLKQSLQDILGDQVNYYDDKLTGLFLSYKNPKLLSENAALLYDSYSCHIDIEADFYIFRPKVGYILKGTIIKKPANHLGVLVHKAFNVSIPRRDDETEDWQGDHLNVGDEVSFTVELMDLKPGKAKLPFIRGKLVDSDYTDETVPIESGKHNQFTPEDVNFEVFNSDEEDNGEISRIDVKKPKFSSTVNEGNSSESERETLESAKSQRIQADSDEVDETITDNAKGKIQEFSSSSDSDNKPEVFNKPRKKELSKKHGKMRLSSEDLGEEAQTLGSPRKKSQERFDKSKRYSDGSGNNSIVPDKSRKTKRDKIQADSSDDSDDDVPFSGKSVKKDTFKKASKEKKGIQRNSDDKISNFDKSIEKSSSPVKTSEKSAKKRQSSDDFNDNVPIFNKNAPKIKENLISMKHKIKVNDSKKNSSGNTGSDDSDDEMPFSNKSIKKSSSPVKPLKKLVPRDSDDSDDNVPFSKSKISSQVDNLSHLKPKKIGKDKNNFGNRITLNESNGEADNKSMHKLPKKIEKSSRIITRDSDDSNDDLPIFSKSIKQESPKKSKRKTSESENSMSVEDSSRKIKKQSKKLKKSSHENLGNTGRTQNGRVESDEEDNEPLDSISTSKKKNSGIIQERVPNRPKPKANPQKRNTKSAHDISSSEDSEAENTNRPIKIEKELIIKNDSFTDTQRLSPHNSDCDSNKMRSKPSKKSSNSINDDVDSDDDFASFMLIRKIEPDVDNSKPAVSNSTGLNPSRKKSKMKSQNGKVEDNYVQLLLHAEHIKSEEDESRRNKLENKEDKESDSSRKITKDKKKTQKSKNSEDEPIAETNVRVKKEKKTSFAGNGSSERIPSLRVAEDRATEVDNSVSEIHTGGGGNSELPSIVNKEKKKKRSKHSNAQEPSGEDNENVFGMLPLETLKAKKRSSKTTLASPENNEELSDAGSIKSRIVVQKEESVFFTNIKIKQEPCTSDVESVSSRKRKRSISIQLNERTDTFENLTIKRESSVVKSEPNEKAKRNKNELTIKSEVNSSDAEDSPPKKKSKKKFSE